MIPKSWHWLKEYLFFYARKKSQSLAYIYPFTTLDTKLDFQAFSDATEK